MKRKMQRVLEQAFPGKKDLIEKVDWQTTQQASKNLLRVRSMASRVNSAEMQKMLKRAELDLEVARKVTY
jgi:isocitrate dehydrogenase kinase/phosphatase